jgi:flavin reductase (DIM6/NTAB) family NADH-FMN oxidoreductase RutF
MSNDRETSNLPPLDSLAYRHTIGLFATGVTVVASGEGDGLRAMTANAVTSLSLDPMLLIVCVHKKASLAAKLLKEKGFSVNILRQEQQDLSNYFAGGWRDEGTPPPFEFLPWHGGPRLKGSVASLGCEHDQILEGGDHWIVIGRVIALHQGKVRKNPLLFYRGRYRRLATDPEYDIPAVWDFAW